MTYIAAMISLGISIAYAGSHEDKPVLIALGLALYLSGIFIGPMVEDRTEDRIKKLEKEIKELKANGGK